jgi:hypothetical protein
MFSSVPFLMGVIEPATYQDIEARYLYMVISSISAAVVLKYYSPKDNKEALARIGAACVMAFAFTEPVAERIRPYVTATAHPEAAPIAAALPAAVFLGICGWWVMGFVAWFSKSPMRIFRVIDWWRGKIPAQSIFIEDPGSTLVTKTKGVEQGQPGNSVTLTPSQVPEKQVTVESTVTTVESTKTTS